MNEADRLAELRLQAVAVAAQIKELEVSISRQWDSLEKPPIRVTIKVADAYDGGWDLVTKFTKCIRYELTIDSSEYDAFAKLHNRSGNDSRSSSSLGYCWQDGQLHGFGSGMCLFGEPHARKIPCTAEQWQQLCANNPPRELFNSHFKNWEITVEK